MRTGLLTMLKRMFGLVLLPSWVSIWLTTGSTEWRTKSIFSGPHIASITPPKNMYVWTSLINASLPNPLLLYMRRGLVSAAHFETQTQQHFTDASLLCFIMPINDRKSFLCHIGSMDIDIESVYCHETKRSSDLLFLDVLSSLGLHRSSPSLLCSSSNQPSLPILDPY